MAKDTRIVAGKIQDTIYYYASDGMVVDENGKPAPAKFAVMFPPMPEKVPEAVTETKPKKRRKGLKNVAGKISNSKYYYDPTGAIVDDQGQPAPERIAKMLLKKDETANVIKEHLAKTAKPIKTASSREINQLRAEIKKMTGATKDVAAAHDLVLKKIPDVSNGYQNVLSNIGTQLQMLFDGLIKQNEDFQNKVMDTITGTVSPTRSGGSVPHSPNTHKSKKTTGASKYQKRVSTMTPAQKKTHSDRIQERANRIGFIRAKNNVATLAKVSAAGAIAGTAAAIGGYALLKSTGVGLGSKDKTSTPPIKEPSPPSNNPEQKATQANGPPVSTITEQQGPKAPTQANGPPVSTITEQQGPKAPTQSNGAPKAPSVTAAIAPPAPQPNSSVGLGGGPSGQTPEDSPAAEKKNRESGAGGNTPSPPGTPANVSGMMRLTTPGGRPYEVAAPYAANFKGFVDELENSGYKIKSIGGYANRNIAGTGKKSYHSLGVAIDINPGSNPHLFDGRLQTDMPASVGAMAAKYGLGWGGNWRTSKDAMHFSMASGEGGSVPVDRSGATPLPGAPGAPTTTPQAGSPEVSRPSASTPSAPGAAPRPVDPGIGSPERSNKPLAGGGSFESQAPALMRRLQGDFGLTAAQAAGIVGNLGHESGGLKAGIQEKGVKVGRGGLGWAQWTGPRRRAFEAYLQQTGQEATDPEANYGFLKVELNGTHKRAIDAIKRTNDVRGAMMEFERVFEAAGVKHYDSRLQYANKALTLSGDTGSQMASAGDVQGRPQAVPPGGASAAAAGSPQDVLPSALPAPGAAPTNATQASVNANAAAGGDSSKPANVSFESSKVDVSKVDPELMKRFYQAAAAYGGPIRINSAYRDDAYQAQLWVRGNILHEPGIHIPAKPEKTMTINYKGQSYTVPGSGKGSSHGKGQALDVSPTTALDPFLAKFGLVHPFGANDPPHIQLAGGSNYSPPASGTAVAGAPAAPGVTPTSASSGAQIASAANQNAVQQAASPGKILPMIVNNTQTFNNTRTVTQQAMSSGERPCAGFNPMTMVAGVALGKVLRLF